MTDEAVDTGDEAAARAGSARSRVMTLVGLYQRSAGGWLSSGTLVQLAEAAEVAGPQARTAMTRMKKKGILVPERRGKTAGYRLSPEAVRLLDEGDHRILRPRTMRIDDAWCLVSFSVPESQRALRALVRRRLAQIGCGPVAAALWIGPDHLRDEMERVLEDLGIRPQAVLFPTPRPLVDGALSDAVARWWDLPALAAAHRAFASVAAPLLSERAVDDADAFRRYVVGVDAWRPVSFLDPGLPYELLPADWPGRESAALFHDLRWNFADRAQAFVDRACAETAVAAEAVPAS